MSTPIRILSLEDSPFDAELIERELRRSGLDARITRVDSEEGFQREITSSDYDVVLADYNLPFFHGIAALEIAREVRPDLPFIFVSGSIGEERATQALREGATDYVLKDRLKRLPSAILRALSEARERKLRRDAEESLRQRERDLERARRVNSLGRVAATIAHEFNNIMMGIQPFAEVIRRRSTDERVIKAADQIAASVARGRRVTQEILRFTKPAEPALQEVILDEWLGKLTPELRALVGTNVAVTLELPPQRIAAKIDPLQMQQVLTNLVLNARDAMPEGGTVTIGTSECNEFATITVADTGTGIPAHLLPTIFDPLFTTKRTGTGLGLAVAHQVVTAHGGTIRVESSVGTGAIFTIEVPTEERVLIRGSRHAAAAVRRLLIVDADAEAANTLAMMLEGEGIESRVVTSLPELARAIESYIADAVVVCEPLAVPDAGREIAELAADVVFIRAAKPYDLAELLVRLESVRNARSEQPATYRNND